MLSIRNNMLALNANRQLNVTSIKSAKNTEKLSSGYRINRAADDAAGLAVSEKMRRQIRGLHQGAENIQDGIGYVKTADGALNEAQDILQRINELSVKAANGTNTQEDRAYIDQEIQALKAELARIFGTTSYNERFIWEPTGVKRVEGTGGVGGTGGVEPDREIIDWKEEQAARFLSTNSSTRVTNDNCGVIALGYYTIHADLDKGVSVSWTGYDGNPYETEPISWDEFKEKNYRFDMGDYFGKKTPDNKLYDASGEPVFRHEIALSVHEKATIEDIIACIDKRTMTSSQSTNLQGRFEDGSGTDLNSELTKGITVSEAHLYYNAAYASHHRTGDEGKLKGDRGLDFSGVDDDFFEPRDADGNKVQGQGSSASGGNLTSEPSASTVAEARESREGWEFSFYLEGIGTVTAKSSSVSYNANDLGDADCEGIFWYMYDPKDGREPYPLPYLSIPSNSHGGGTLGDVMDALTGGKDDKTPGLLTQGNGGWAHSGGTISIRFNLTSDQKFEYGSGGESSNVGYFTIRIPVTSGETEADIFSKITGVLNDKTILDFSSPGQSASFSKPVEATHKIKTEPIYGDVADPPGTPADPGEYVPMCGFFVQAGPEAGMHIDIEYEPLSLRTLGLESTNVLTAEDAGRAIDEVKNGLLIVSAQRANFGAYENRLEHAHNINLISEENTQYAESQIRDTDVAKLMIEHANLSILSQAGVSMLTQANQQPGIVMQLLQ